MKKPVYEWVVSMTKGPPFYLTENQYEAFDEAKDQGWVRFRNVQINPSFFVSAYKREATALFQIYPCMKCATRGFLILNVKKDKEGNWPECSDCKGTGINAGQDPKPLNREEDSQY